MKCAVYVSLHLPKSGLYFFKHMASSVLTHLCFAWITYKCLCITHYHLVNPRELLLCFHVCNIYSKLRHVALSLYKFLPGCTGYLGTFATYKYLSIKRMHSHTHGPYTVNLEIFATVLFSRNFADAEFRENKTLAKWRKLFVLYLCR